MFRNWGVRQIRRLAAPESGAATTEYALVLALVVVILITTLTSLGAALQDRIQSIIDSISGGN